LADPILSKPDKANIAIRTFVQARPEQLSLSDFLALFRKLEAKQIEGKVLPPSKDVLNASEVA
jgi:hypothetical protein